MKNSKNAYYICAGRAETHVLEDLLHFIKCNLLSGASIDVHGLPNGRIQKNVLENKMINLTPHISGWTTNFWTLQKNINA